MDIIKWLETHWVQIGVCWFAIQNLLKALQDTMDAIPKGLPPLAKIYWFMQGIGGYLFLGNRPQPIGATNVKNITADTVVITTEPGKS